MFSKIIIVFNNNKKAHYIVGFLIIKIYFKLLVFGFYFCPGISQTNCLVKNQVGG